MVSMGTWVLGSCILKTCPSIKRNHNFYLVLFWLKVSLFHLVGSSFQDGVLVGSRLGREVFSSPTKMLKVILEDPAEFARIKDIRRVKPCIYFSWFQSSGVNGVTAAPELRKPTAAGCLTRFKFLSCLDWQAVWLLYYCIVDNCLLQLQQRLPLPHLPSHANSLQSQLHTGYLSLPFITSVEKSHHSV